MKKPIAQHSPAYRDALLLCGLRRAGKDETRRLIRHAETCRAWRDEPCTCGAQPEAVPIERWLRHLSIWN
jgi:hypothetical protein